MKLYIFLSLITLLFSCNINRTEKKVDKKNEIITSISDTSNIDEYWSNKIITNAVIYYYKSEYNRKDGVLIIDRNNNLHSTVVDSLTTELSPLVVQKLNQKIRTKTDYMEDHVSHCFNPHHGIVLKNKDKIIGHISICFECNQYRLNPENVSYIPMDFFKELCIEAKIPISRHNRRNNTILK